MECDYWSKEDEEELSYHIKLHNISWAQFETCNQDPLTAFEKMCRSLFNHYYFDRKALLHSNPNNPGIEVEPILDTKSNKRISFQAKYFSSIDYPQVKHSAEQTIKHYSGQLDILYLYCNKDLSTISKPYKDIKAILKEGNIELILINNQTILDQVIDDPIIALLYFNHHGLTNDWFNEHLKINFDSLGPRYNNYFNVETKTEEYIDLFSQNVESIARINQKKSDAAKAVKENHWQYRGHNDLIDRICSAINSIGDITSGNILQCLDWAATIRKTFSKEVAELIKKRDDKKNTLITSSVKIEKEKQIEIEREIRGLQYLIDFPSLLELNEIEKKLLQRKVLIIQGDAGVGKSQLFANAARKSFQSNGHALLLLGHLYLSNDPITMQIPFHLGLPFNIDELFNILEGIGERNQCVIVFIDAINESGNKDIWKTGLIHLFSKLDKLNYVRLAISVRTGYEQLVFDEAVQQKIQCGEYARLVHTGFQEESVEATKTFLNYYNIPFSPSYFLQHEMTNPLFLTLFCKTYTGEDFDIFTLFERIIERADKEAQKAAGLDGSSALLKNLIHEIAEFQLSQGRRAITMKELFELSFWNIYGMNNRKIPFTAALERAGLLISYVYGETESYFLGYNLLENFICAKLIMEKYPDKKELKNYLQLKLLRIENGKITNFSNVDIFIVVCSLYAEKYKEECIDIIDNLSDDFEKHHIVESYINSFLWRKTSTVDSGAFIEFINHHAVGTDNVWRILIENSTKPNHPLNAVRLHNVLLNKSLSYRDYLWTTYINGLANDEERLFQLIDFFNKGNSLDGLTNDSIRLLLILFSWLLTSSNRFLRDKASKAMIELLKTNFQMCKPLLETFESVNDPYVIQRLYGIVFGACMKRTAKYKTEYIALSKYVFNTVFNKITVYPDMLLRDYARLILERFLYEFPSDCGIIDIAKIRPPYSSAEIPIIKKEEYYQRDSKNNGFNSIAMSMYPEGIEGPGMYGDFGRYVFQSAVTDFDGINLDNLYHYAMQFIRDELGYDDKLFGNYDTSSRHHYYDRHETKKTERIGKKYQWIAMYNILARISDTHLLKHWHEEPYQFEGAWEPYIRDFDPTLNCNFLVPTDWPNFDLPENKSDEFIVVSSNNKSEIREWAGQKCAFYDSHPFKLMIGDDSDKKWIFLNQYEEKNTQSIDRHSFSFINGSQKIWSMSHGYVVRENEFELLKNNLKEKNFMGRWFPESQDIYQLFNREYAWAPGYQSLLGSPWIDYEVDTDEKIITKHTGGLPKFISSKNTESEDIEDILFFEEQEWEQVETLKRTLGQVMPTYSRVLWEEQYDASQEEATSFYVPCKDILENLQLEQKEYDGYFYSKDGTLVSFDGELANICNGLIIRKDYLDKYLNENNLRLFWVCLGEKQYFLGERHQIWGEWSGFFYLEGDNVIGAFENKKLGP